MRSLGLRLCRVLRLWLGERRGLWLSRSGMTRLGLRWIDEFVLDVKVLVEICTGNDRVSSSKAKPFCAYAESGGVPSPLEWERRTWRT